MLTRRTDEKIRIESNRNTSKTASHQSSPHLILSSFKQLLSTMSSTAPGYGSSGMLRTAFHILEEKRNHAFKNQIFATSFLMGTHQRSTSSSVFSLHESPGILKLIWIVPSPTRPTKIDDSFTRWVCNCVWAPNTFGGTRATTRVGIARYGQRSFDEPAYRLVSTPSHERFLERARLKKERRRKLLERRATS